MLLVQITPKIRSPSKLRKIDSADSLELPKNSTWLVMTNLPGDIQKSVGNIYGLRTWIEYGLKQSKNELGWADYRLTDYPEIEKWWETVYSAY